MKEMGGLEDDNRLSIEKKIRKRGFWKEKKSLSGNKQGFYLGGVNLFYIFLF